MQPRDDKKYLLVPKTALWVLLLVLAAGLLGWWVGHTNSPIPNGPLVSQPTVPISNNNTADVASLIRYNLPDGWKDANCPGSKSVFVLPAGVAEAACNTNLIAPIKLTVDPGNTKDCNELQNASDVKKHVCISLYIHGLKSLKASTEYLASSSYKQATTINTYYIDTGKGVVKLEYQFTSDNQYQAGFDQLANSVNKR